MRNLTPRHPMRRRVVRQPLKKRRRGAGLRDWVRRGLALAKKHKAISRLGSNLYQNRGKAAIAKIKNPLLRRGTTFAIEKGLDLIKKKGYGLSRSGGALRRAGMGTRRVVRRR